MKNSTRKMKRLTALTLTALLVASLAAALPVRGKEPGDPSAAVIVLKHCALEYDQTTQLVALLPSVLQDRLVRRGDAVKAGQVLGRLFDQEVRAERDISAAAAENDVEVRIARAEYTRAYNKFAKTQTLHKRQFISSEEVDLDSLAVEKAKLAIEEAQQKRKIARLNQQKAEAQVRSREFVSPHDGVVIEVTKNQGESVTLHEPVFKIVNDRILRVTGALNVADAWRVKRDQPVRIRPDVAGAELDVEREAFAGKITFVDRRIDSESQTCQVIAEVTNRDGLLKAGLDVQMEIWPTDLASTQAPAGARPVKPRP